MRFLHHAAVNYVGCYTRGPFEPAGDYAPDSLTPDLCTTRCGSAGAGFAVLRNGDQCLCSRSLEEDKKVGDARCNEPCKGNLAFNCGGFESFSAYRTLRNYTLAMAMTIPRNVSLFETVNTSFTSLAGATYTADFGENILVASSCPLVPYSFHTLGSHAVHAQISTGEYEGPLTLVATSQVRTASMKAKTAVTVPMKFHTVHDTSFTTLRPLHPVSHLKPMQFPSDSTVFHLKVEEL